MDCLVSGNLQHLDELLFRTVIASAHVAECTARAKLTTRMARAQILNFEAARLSGRARFLHTPVLNGQSGPVVQIQAQSSKNLESP